MKAHQRRLPTRLTHPRIFARTIVQSGTRVTLEDHHYLLTHFQQVVQLIVCDLQSLWVLLQKIESAAEGLSHKTDSLLEELEQLLVSEVSVIAYFG